MKMTYHYFPQLSFDHVICALADSGDVVAFRKEDMAHSYIDYFKAIFDRKGILWRYITVYKRIDNINFIAFMGCVK